MTAYLNGEFLPLSAARISPLDRGFLFGDGVYEVIPVYGGKPLRLEEHLRRLDQSLAAIRTQSPGSTSAPPAVPVGDGRRSDVDAARSRRHGRCCHDRLGDPAIEAVLRLHR